MTDAFAWTKQDVARTPERARRPSACALQRARYPLIAGCVRPGALALALVSALVTGSRAAPAPFAGPLEWPLSGNARELRGGFGEPRAGHFHAGLDLSTARHTGADVLAPAKGTMERARMSGVGYGRSLYLRTADGRLLVFGHLDAFEPDLAAYVDSVQRASGVYEQDLWLPEGRFRYAAGARIAWSGESGAGPPHLHVEIRHADFALNPLLAGLAVADTVAPRIEQLVLEPLDERSWVERSAAPHVQRMRASEETLLVEGRVRLTLQTSDATNTSPGLPVHAVGARWNGAWVECRMDSISWAGEMSQLAWLLDGGRVVGGGGAILDAPAGFRPRFLLGSRPDSEAMELVRVDAGAAARALELYARDAAGNESTRRVWLRGPLWRESGPDTTQLSPLVRAPRHKGAKGAKSAKPAPSVAAEPRWTFACLPDQRVRVRVTGAPGGLSGVRFERGGSRPDQALSAPATWDGRGWCAVLDVNGTPDPDGFWIKGRGADGRAWWHRGNYALWPSASPMVARIEDWAWFNVDAASAYEPGVVMVRPALITGLAAGASGVRAALSVEPPELPLRKSVSITLVLPAGLSPSHTGMYRRDAADDAWDWEDARWDSSSRTFRADSDRLGQFALIRDEAGPELTLRAAATHVRATAYPQWALTAHALDRTSGIAGRECFFAIDGVRVPTEWDPEAHLLRWRPRTAPTPGRHPYRVEAVDRAGNRTVRSGAFVIASR